MLGGAQLQIKEALVGRSVQHTQAVQGSEGPGIQSFRVFSPAHCTLDTVISL